MERTLTVVVRAPEALRTLDMLNVDFRDVHPDEKRIIVTVADVIAPITARAKKWVARSAASPPPSPQRTLATAASAIEARGRLPVAA